MARRNRNNTADSRHYFDWLDRSEEDIISAAQLMNNKDCFNNTAFHCQQTIEKALKSYILLKSGELCDGHNLTWLCKRAMRHDGGFNQWLDECASLNRCYIETRYPADIPVKLTAKTVGRYYQMARDMHDFIRTEIEEATGTGME